MGLLLFSLVVLVLEQDDIITALKLLVSQTSPIFSHTFYYLQMKYLENIRRPVNRCLEVPPLSLANASAKGHVCVLMYFLM